MSRKLSASSVWRGGYTTKKVHPTGEAVKLVAKPGKLIAYFSVTCGRGWSNLEVHIGRDDFEALFSAMMAAMPPPEK